MDNMQTTTANANNCSDTSNSSDTSNCSDIYSTLLRSILVALNLLLALMGASGLCLSGLLAFRREDQWLLSSASPLSLSLMYSMDTLVTENTSLLTAVLASILILVAVIGWCAVLTMNRCFLLLDFVLLLTLWTLSTSLKQNMRTTLTSEKMSSMESPTPADVKRVEETLMQSLTQYDVLATDPVVIALTAQWDATQASFNCCGVLSHRDWTTETEGSFPDERGHRVPRSCCHSFEHTYTEDNKKEEKELDLDLELCLKRPDSSRYVELMDGCLMELMASDALLSLTESKEKSSSIVAFFPMVFNIFLALMLSSLFALTLHRPRPPRLLSHS